LVAAVVLVRPIAAQAGNFTFVHLSDQHFPHDATSADVIQQVTQLGAVRLAPFGIDSDPPSFAISTGDMTEFGADGWQQYLTAWQGAPFPVYHQTGNHDNTWTALRQHIRELHGSDPYSFDYGGCHFVGLDTATPQDPRPSIGREVLLWLERDLAKVSVSTPLFAFMHHPIPGSEFASEFDYDRLLDRLAGHNVVLFLAGHSHGAAKFRPGAFDGIMGGSTFGKIPGYAIVTLRDGKLHVAYRVAAEPEATRELLTKEIPSLPLVPPVTISSPAEGAEVEPGNCRVEASLADSPHHIAAAQVAVDGKTFLDLTLIGRRAVGAVPAEHLSPGAHRLRVGFKTDTGEVFGRSTFVYVPASEPRVLWRTFLDGSSKSAPLVTGGRLYVGANDGKLYCLETGTGRILWAFPTGGEVLTEPCLTEAGICFGSGDGLVYTVNPEGREVWRQEMGSAVYSSPVAEHGLVFFGSNSGRFYCLSARTGQVKWTCQDPTYGIESKPFLADGVVYFGAWDQYVYAVRAGTGELLWKCKGEASATKPAARYYSPADCGPVAAGGKVFIPDRGYLLSVIDAKTGQRLAPVASVGGVSLALDGSGVILRKTKGVAKWTLAGEQVWETEVETGFLPTTVASGGDRLYVVSDRGLLSCLDASSGRVVYQYQVTPRLWVMSTPAVRDGTLYVSAMDGSVTAIR
jgi:outer membrane protein assembly factor BamB